MMRVRAGRLEHPRAWSQSPRNRTNHVVSNVIIEHEDLETGEIVARAKFIVVEFRLDEQRYLPGPTATTSCALRRGCGSGFSAPIC
jgi:3-phenylpropionate/cinnamic acid dioxygenase small subunit